MKTLLNKHHSDALRRVVNFAVRNQFLGALEDDLEPFFAMEKIARYGPEESIAFRRFVDFGILSPVYGGTRCPVCEKSFSESVDKLDETGAFFTCTNGHPERKICVFEVERKGYKLSFKNLHEVLCHRMDIAPVGVDTGKFCSVIGKCVYLGIIHKFDKCIRVYYVRELMPPWNKIRRYLSELQSSAADKNPIVVISPTYEPDHIRERPYLLSRWIEVVPLPSVVAGFRGIHVFEKVPKDPMADAQALVEEFQTECKVSIRQDETKRGELIVASTGLKGERTVRKKLERREVEVLIALAEKMRQDARHRQKGNADKGWASFAWIKTKVSGWRAHTADSVVRAQICQIRSRLPGHMKRLLETRRGFGYRLSTDPGNIRFITT